MGIIERSIRGFWWWMVSEELGAQQGGGREITLREAKKSADVLINRTALRVFREKF